MCIPRKGVFCSIPVSYANVAEREASSASINHNERRFQSRRIAWRDRNASENLLKLTLCSTVYGYVHIIPSLGLFRVTRRRWRPKAAFTLRAVTVLIVNNDGAFTLLADAACMRIAYTV